jgi:hypothetical protein
MMALAAMVALAATWFASSGGPKPPASGARIRATERTRVAAASRVASNAATQSATPGMSGVTGVVRASSGGALARVSVCLWPQQHIEMSVTKSCTETDQTGTFRMQAGPGTWLLTARGGVGLRDLTQDVQVSAGAIVSVQLVLSPGGATLAGEVMDASGGPISNAMVVAYLPGVTERPDEALLTLAATDEHGRFSLSASEGGIDLRVSADGYATALVSTSAPKAGLEVALLRGSSVTGIVENPAREPVAGVLVQARSEQSLGGIAQAVSRQDGSFSISGISEGAAYLRVVSDHWFAEPLRLAIEPDSEHTGVRLVASRGTTIRGTILVNDEPCATHGQVLLSGPATFGADAQAGGAVKLAGVPPATYRVRAHCDGALDYVGMLELTGDGPPLTWRLSRGCSVRVKVQGRERDISHQLTVQALATQPQVGTAADDAPSRAVDCAYLGEKLFDCRGLSATAHRFSLSTAGRVLTEAEAVLSEGANPEVVLLLPQTGAVHVSLLNVDPLGTDVVADGPVFATGIAAPDGSFSFDFLPPGAYTVRTQDSTASAHVDVAGGAVANITLTLPATEELRGIVLDLVGQPVSDATVLLRRKGAVGANTVRQRRTDSDGHFSFGELLRARYGIAVESSAGAGEFLVETSRALTLRVPSAPLLPEWFAQQGMR